MQGNITDWGKEVKKERSQEESLEIRPVEKSASAAITISRGFMCTVTPE